MLKQSKEAQEADVHFRLMSLAAWIKKVRSGIQPEELWRDAERKFDILTDVISGKYNDEVPPGIAHYTMAELRRHSYLILNRLISESKSNPYHTLCVHEHASIGEIKRRRNKLLHIFHPDMNLNVASNGAQTRKITEAFEQIASDSSRRGNGHTSLRMNFPPTFNFEKKFYKNRIVLVMIFIILFVFILGIMKTTNFF